MVVSQINFAIVLRTTLDKFCSLLAANQIKENLVVVQLVATQVKCGVDWRGLTKLIRLKWMLHFSILYGKCKDKKLLKIKS